MTSSPPSVLSVPFELLSKIFSFIYDDIGNAGFVNVCRYWRAVALASPDLWSRVIVRNSGRGLAAILERSQSCPLTIRATLEDDPFYVIPAPGQQFPTPTGELQPRMMTTRNISPDLHKILEILFSHSQRWSDVSLRLSPNLFYFLDDLDGSFPILQKMYIEMIYPAEFLDGLPLVSSDAFAVAPRLNHLVIANIRFGVLFPGNNLRTLHLTKFATLVEIFEVVREAPYLTKLVATRVQNCIIDERIPRSRTPIVHSSLREIEFHRIHGIGFLLLSFILPNLESFTLDEFDDMADFAVIRLLYIFFAASLSPLRKFSLRGIMPSGDIPFLLGAIPTVTDLVISQTMHGDAIRFGELVARTLLANGGLLPQLRSLNLYSTDYPKDDVHDELTGSIFADMIASRWENSAQVVKLEHVRVGGYKHGFGTSVIERFELFKRQGLDISWVGQGKSLPEEKPLLNREPLVLVLSYLLVPVSVGSPIIPVLMKRQLGIARTQNATHSIDIRSFTNDTMPYGEGEFRDHTATRPRSWSESKESESSPHQRLGLNKSRLHIRIGAGVHYTHWLSDCPEQVLPSQILRKDIQHGYLRADHAYQCPRWYAAAMMQYKKALAYLRPELTRRIHNSDTTLSTDSKDQNVSGYHSRSMSMLHGTMVTMNVVSWAQIAVIILCIYYIVAYLERALRRRLRLKHTCILDIDTLGRRLHNKKINGTAAICGGRMLSVLTHGIRKTNVLELCNTDHSLLAIGYMSLVRLFPNLAEECTSKLSSMRIGPNDLHVHMWGRKAITPYRKYGGSLPRSLMTRSLITRHQFHIPPELGRELSGLPVPYDECVQGSRGISYNSVSASPIPKVLMSYRRPWKKRKPGLEPPSTDVRIPEECILKRTVPDNPINLDVNLPIFKFRDSCTASHSGVPQKWSYAFATTVPVPGETLSEGAWLRWYIKRLTDLSFIDAQASSALWHLRVLLAPPTYLLQPALVLKVVWNLSVLVVALPKI
ncbi:hypothetical protein IW261DRAFT_1414756 [Armillaria novae-zelandiae]|uniref:F-box domain-containing protein n=1 Tax=Armillaria novae-zelandiae TaxID=153914 RepID=A0AA39PRX6_9AGAR|nr:hypothetical protein IW261DRAFT_1414756 [Armillaria novae-zelandiae]